MSQKENIWSSNIRCAVVCALLLFSGALFSQRSLVFSGKVIDRATGMNLEKTIIEINGENYSVDNKADFEIYLLMNDTVIFRHLGYAPYELIVSESLEEADLPRFVLLQVENVKLDEVTVAPSMVTEEMQRNAQYNVQQAVAKALGKGSSVKSYDNRSFADQEPSSGVSSSQMFGADLVGLVGLVKKSKKKIPVMPTTKVISYEEYRSTLTATEAKDSTKTTQ